MKRLVIASEYRKDTVLLGVRCVRFALETAAESGADFVRCEVNPHLKNVYEMLQMLGFLPICPEANLVDNNKAYLQKKL
jgi:hypothetical protein